MRHAAVHWPANAGGEHPDRETIYGLPGVRDGALLIVADSARYWYDEARKRCPLVVWRGLPRPNKLPAHLGWDTRKVANEVTNLWDEQPHGEREWFLPLNELQFSKEAGEDWRGYTYMAARLAPLRVQLRSYFESLGQDVGLMFPAWVPQDDGDRLHEWAFEAERWDAIAVHCYGGADTMRHRYQSYRDAFPGKPLFVGEWNSNHEEHDERASLEMWAEVAAGDPLFMGATYYIWETNNSGENDLSIWGKRNRLHLFRNPPAAAVAPTPPPIVEPAPEPPTPEPVPEVPTVDPWRYFSAERIAADVPANIDAVRENWPPVADHLERFGIYDLPTTIAALATIGVEVGSKFSPINEYGDDEYFERMYGPGSAVAEQLGNVNPGDGARYHGRGLIQLTGRSNYRAYGNALQVPLEDMPDEALHPIVSAAVLAMYFRDRGVPALAAAGDWQGVRRAVNGGLNGWAVFKATVNALGRSVAPAPPLVYDAAYPTIAQGDSWSCAPTSLRWAMHAFGRRPTEAWIEGAMIAQGVVSQAQGLLDASGHGLAAFVDREYAEFGYGAWSSPSVSFNDVRSIAGTSPVLLGGRAWNHWSGVRGYDAGGLMEDVLLLANPSVGWGGVGQTMTRQQFAALGPFSMVVVTHASATPVPVPTPTDPRDARIAQLEAEVADKDRRLSEVVSLLGVARGDRADALQREVDALRALVPSS